MANQDHFTMCHIILITKITCYVHIHCSKFYEATLLFNLYFTCLAYYVGRYKLRHLMWSFNYISVILHMYTLILVLFPQYPLHVYKQIIRLRRLYCTWIYFVTGAAKNWRANPNLHAACEAKLSLEVSQCLIWIYINANLLKHIQYVNGFFNHIYNILSYLAPLTQFKTWFTVKC